MIEVVWLSLHPDTVASRGYWDQAMLEDFFAERLWRFDVPMKFRHHVIEGVSAWPDARGIVLVLPARGHVGDIGRINAELAAYEWAVVIVGGDEENLFPWHELDPEVDIVRQTPMIRDGERNEDVWSSLYFGHGYTPNTHEIVAECGEDYQAKKSAVIFMGQDTHPRRHDLVEMWPKIEGHHKSLLGQTDGFAHGAPRETYLRQMVSARIALCPAGPATVDSFRFYEALEAGCVPILDGRTTTYGQRDYWQALLGDDLPFPIIDDWTSAAAVVDRELQRWPRNANACLAWWMKYKRGFVKDLSAVIGRRAGIDTPIHSSRAVTALVPTSPIPDHPSIEMITETIDSIRSRLPDAEVIVMIDGVRDEQAKRGVDYEQYIRNLLWFCHTHDNILPLVFDEHLHQAAMTKAALSLVRTPTVLFVEHDTPLEGSIDFDGCVRVVLSGDANSIKFHHESQILDVHQHLMVHDEVQLVDGVPLLGTMQWSQRPHLASTVFYRELMDAYFGWQSRTMIEDTMHGVLDYEWRHGGAKAWRRRWRTFIYAPDGSIRRSGNLDGRGDDPKFEMIYEYDGNVIPPGAPYPTSMRVD